MKSSDYWQKRFQAVEAMNNKTAKETVQSVTPAFDKAQVQIEKEINAWYGRFAKNNQITLQEAKKLLTSKELKEFRWDVEEYIKYGKQNALDQAWMKQLENASSRFHISRLEALKIRTQNAAERAFGNELDQIDEMAARIYTDDYYHTAYEIQRGLGIGWDVGQIDQRKLDNIVSKPWTADKQTFSDRIWKSKTQLIDSLHTEMTQMCVLGKSPDQAINNIAKRMNVSKGQAGRLVMTEAAYFGSAAQKDCFNDLDVEKFEVIATLDNRTSEVCQEMDGKVFDMKDFQVGVTAPPFHVWCRSCTAPWFPDNDDGTRAARGADGKTYQVPASMKYDDWKRAFVDGGSKDGLEAVNGIRFMWSDDFTKEAQKSYTDKFNELSEMYPLDNVKIEAVGDTFEIRGWNRNLPDDKIREDIVYDELGQMFGAQYMPKGMNVLPSKGAFIEIADNERKVISLDDWFKQMRDHRIKNGKPKTLAQCFNNVAEGTEAIITHEYAHAIADNYGFYGSDKGGKWLRDIFDKYDDLEIAKQLSRYATTSPDEFFAECFVKSFDKYSESKIAKEVMDEFRKRYGLKPATVEDVKKAKRSLEELNAAGTKTLGEAYEHHRIDNNLNVTPYDELAGTKLNPINADYGKLSEETASAFNETLTELVSEYDTPLQKIRTFTKEEALNNSFAFVNHNYSVDSAELVINPLKMKDHDKMVERIKELSERGYCVKIPEELADKYVATHEFAHTLINLKQPLSNKTNWVGADYSKIKKVRKEINDVYEKYMVEVERLTKVYKTTEMDALLSVTSESWEAARTAKQALNSVKLSNYSLESADEFMAEAFTNEKIGVASNPYAKEVVDILNKYFKR